MRLQSLLFFNLYYKFKIEIELYQQAFKLLVKELIQELERARLYNWKSWPNIQLQEQKNEQKNYNRSRKDKFSFAWNYDIWIQKQKSKVNRNNLTNHQKE